MILILMGVAGSGKTTLGKKLAEKLDWLFLEGDDFHSDANKMKMGAGIPLTEEDRLPWLKAIGGEINLLASENINAVLACSALKESYRAQLSRQAPVRWVYLKGSGELIRRRLEGRKGHFMKPELLDSQFSILEEPQQAIVVDIRMDPDKLIQLLVDQLKGT